MCKSLKPICLKQTKTYPIVVDWERGIRDKLEEKMRNKQWSVLVSKTKKIK